MCLEMRAIVDLTYLDKIVCVQEQLLLSQHCFVLHKILQGK